MSYYDLYSYLPFLLSTTKSNNNKSKNVNYPTTPYQNANYLSSNSLSKHDKQYRRTTTTAARYTDKYNCTSANYQQRSIVPSIHTQITIKTSNTTAANYLNSPNAVNFMNNTQNYFNNSSANNPAMNATNCNPATTANPTTNYYNPSNYYNNNTHFANNFMNNTQNYFNRPLEEQLLRPEIDESSLSSKSSCTTHSSFQVTSSFTIVWGWSFFMPRVL